jgi:large subunit ribosomal protein L15
MASRTATRPPQCIIKRARPSCKYVSTRSSTIWQFSASRSKADQWETNREDRPRWSYTPEEMKAPYPWKPKDPSKAFQCNEDPEKLDSFYANFLGRGGDKMLAEEIKWLAITHKSFDQGRRGFNDRLAFFGIRSCRETGFSCANWVQDDGF